MLNPNGPLLNGGSDGDNGQTGRKLVMDYYGPRVPIGGGALSGKDPTHVDRVGARLAREMALRDVKAGAGECLVRLTYAPGVSEPIDVTSEMNGRRCPNKGGESERYLHPYSGGSENFLAPNWSAAARRSIR
jgi:S-adenosylmethionine synthetase